MKNSDVSACKDVKSSKYTGIFCDCARRYSYPRFCLGLFPPLRDISSAFVFALQSSWCFAAKLDWSFWWSHFFFFVALLCVMSNVPAIVIFLTAAYPSHVPLLSLCLKITVIYAILERTLSSVASRLLMALVKLSCFPNTWWYNKTVEMSCALVPNVTFSCSSNFVRIWVVLKAKTCLNLTSPRCVCWHWLASIGTMQSPHSMILSLSSVGINDLIIQVFRIQVKALLCSGVHYQLKHSLFMSCSSSWLLLCGCYNPWWGSPNCRRLGRCSSWRARLQREM